MHNPAFVVDSLADTDFDKAVKEGQAEALEAENFQGQPLHTNLQPKNFWAFFDEDKGCF